MKLYVGIHQTEQHLEPQSVAGRAGLMDVVGDLRTCVAWAFVLNQRVLNCGGGRRPGTVLFSI